MASATPLPADALAGHLQVRPGGPQPLEVARPVVGAAVMQRLTEGRPAHAVPAVLQAVFSLCGTAHAATARRALAAAAGERGPADGGPVRSQHLLQQATALEHLQRLAFDLPTRAPAPGVPADPGWLRGVAGLRPAPERAADDIAAQAAADRAALREWLSLRLLDTDAERWLARWETDPAGHLATWAAESRHPVAQWLHHVRPAAERIVVPVRALAVLDAGEDPLRGVSAIAGRLAGSLAGSTTGDGGYARAPTLADGCRETGPWTRHRLAPAARAADTAWLRFGARVAELVRLAIEPTWLQAGACSTGPHEAIAWTEMSRGLLFHWVRLRPAGDAAGAATAGSGSGSATSGDRVVAAYRVLAPTEWNFHADGALAQWLAGRGAPAPDAAAARLAVTALDPCVAFTVGPAVGDATAAGR